MNLRLIFVLLFLAVSVDITASAVLAQDKGSVDPKPLPPLANPNDPKLGAKELFGRTKEWLPAAGEGTWGLVTGAEQWAKFGRYVSDTPRPQPVMRIVPDV